MVNQEILFDGRWIGQHGIGRFATELQSRLAGVTTQTFEGSPTSPFDALRLGVRLWRSKVGYFSPGFNAPLPLPLAGNRNYVFSIHDLIHVHHPAEASIAKRLYYASVVRAAARRAFAVLTVSEYSKNEIVQWAGIPADRVRVVYNGVGDAFAATGEKLTLDSPYVIYVGNQKPHKNVPALVKAMIRLRAEQGLQLVLSGEPTPETQRVIDECGLSGSVTFLGSVSDEQLAAAYRGAEATVMPSEYEGFGLPLIESMACGTPVISSNATALPEVAGGAAELVDPTSQAITEGVLRVVNDEGRHQELVAAGLIRAKQFSWQRTANIVQELLDELKASSELRCPTQSPSKGTGQ